MLTHRKLLQSKAIAMPIREADMWTVSSTRPSRLYARENSHAEYLVAPLLLWDYSAHKGGRNGSNVCCNQGGIGVWKNRKYNLPGFICSVDRVMFAKSRICQRG